LAGKSEDDKGHFGDPGIDGRKILKLILTKYGVCVWAAQSGSGLGQGLFWT
jgi:hypothetical protein